MVELSSSQAIPSTTTPKTITNELDATRIVEKILHLTGGANIEQQHSESLGSVVELLAQVDCDTTRSDQSRVALASANDAPTTTTFRANPQTSPNLTKSASNNQSDTDSKEIKLSTGTGICKNVFNKADQTSDSTEGVSRISPDISTRNQNDTDCLESNKNYQLRALKGDKSSNEEDNLWSKNFNVPTLSSDLIGETLNYFVNCRNRLCQITKTFDDRDAYILLLQEKEMDLELVARIGQDLLKQFNEVKDSNEALKEELAKFQELNDRLQDELARCRDDNQQLRYELASKVSLLDTFMEEEEEHLQSKETTATSLVRTEANDEEFHSLRSHPDRIVSSTENDLYKRLCELQDELITKDEILFKQNVYHQERNIQLESQLRESDRRLSGLEAENETLRENQKELYDELKTYSSNFAELLRIFSEFQHSSRDNEMGHISVDSFTEQTGSFESNLNSLTIIQEQQHHDTQRHHKSCYNRIGEPIVRGSKSGMVMSSSLHEELRESMLRSGELLASNTDTDDNEFVLEEQVEAEDEDDGSDPITSKTLPTSSPARHYRNYHKQTRYQPNYYQRQNFRRRHPDSDSGGVSDGADSGLHTTTTVSSSTTPINIGLSQETDSDLDANSSVETKSEIASNKKNWLGLSTFTLTTLLLFCLSATLNHTSNSNLAQKLQQIRFDR